MIVAFAIIAGWFFRVASELLPGWDALAVPVAALVWAALVEILDRSIDRAIKNDSGGAP